MTLTRVKEKELGEHNFLGFEPIGNMSKGALKLQKFANNILKNAIKKFSTAKRGKFYSFAEYPTFNREYITGKTGICSGRNNRA